MIRKTIIQGITVAVVFLLTWLALAQVNWVDVLKTDSIRKKIEERLTNPGNYRTEYHSPLPEQTWKRIKEQAMDQSS